MNKTVGRRHRTVPCLLNETIDDLCFLTDPSLDLEDKNNYGTEFRQISIIPSCMEDSYWNGLGWKERKQIWRKKQEADIRLRMDYEHFITETPDNQRLMFIDIIIKSIRVVQERAKGDFMGDKLIEDVLLALKARGRLRDKVTVCVNPNKRDKEINIEL